MALEEYVLERIAQLLSADLSEAAALDLARQILRTLQPGDDLGNGLRAIPITALDELNALLQAPTKRAL